jgi:predicted RNA binding protein YcfA (HicA-like mRNA interferase family)
MVARSRWGSFGARCRCPRERAAAGPIRPAADRALEKVGWVAVRQRGSHVRLKHDERTIALVVPLHRELKRGTLAGILRDAGIERDDLRQLL